MKLKPPPVLGGIIEYYTKGIKDQEEINGKWVIAKPIEYLTLKKLLSRLWYAWLIIKGKAWAVQYARDRYDITGGL